MPATEFRAGMGVDEEGNEKEITGDADEDKAGGDDDAER